MKPTVSPPRSRPAGLVLAVVALAATAGCDASESPGTDDAATVDAGEVSDAEAPNADADADATPTDAAPAPDAAVATSWAFRLASSTGFDDGSGLAVAPDGDLFAAGRVSGAAGELVRLGADDDPGQVTFTTNGAGAAFLTRVHPDGRLAWAVAALSSLSIDADALIALGDRALVAGTFQGTAIFDAGLATQVELASRGGSDAFLALYEPDGTFVWARQLGGSGNELVGDAVALPDGSAVVVGRFTDSAQLGDGAQTTTLTSQGLDDVFVARYAANGDLIWGVAAGGQGNAQALAVAATDDGGIALAGEFQNDLVFDRGTAAELALTSAGALDVFLARLDGDGVIVWARRAGGTDELPTWGESGSEVAVTADGAILLAGDFEVPITFGEGEPNQITLGAPDDWSNRKIFIARFSGGGELQWARASAGGPEQLGWTTVRSLLVRADDSFLVFAAFTEHAIFGPGEPQESELASVGNFDLALASYAADGALAWVRRADSAEPDHPGALLATPDGVYALGTLGADGAIGLTDGAAVSFASAGYSDVFLARLAP